MRSKLGPTWAGRLMSTEHPWFGQRRMRQKAQQPMQPKTGYSHRSHVQQSNQGFWSRLELGNGRLIFKARCITTVLGFCCSNPRPSSHKRPFEGCYAVVSTLLHRTYASCGRSRIYLSLKYH